MEMNHFTVLNYFNYDIEKVLDEFNNYYNIKQNKIPLELQTIFLYFTNLSEIGLQMLIESKYSINQAEHLVKLTPIYERYLTKQEIIQNFNTLHVTPLQYYGLICFSYFFYEYFLQYVKFNQEKQLIKLASHIPIVEHNINLVQEIIKSPQLRTH